MFKKSILCYLCFFVFTAVYCLLTNAKPMIARFDYPIMLIGYLFGASLWFVIPGMINFWLNFKRGYMRWGLASLVTCISTGSLIYLFFGNMPVEPFLTLLCMMGIPASIVQYIVLCPIMRIKATEPDEIEVV